MPIGANTTQALNQIQSVTRLNQVNLNSLSIKAESFLPSRQPLAKRLGTLTVNMAVTGAYDNIKGFLRALETNVRVANTKTFTISPVSGLNQNNYSLTLSVEIYYQEGS